MPPLFENPIKERDLELYRKEKALDSWINRLKEGFIESTGDKIATTTQISEELICGTFGSIWDDLKDEIKQLSPNSDGKLSSDFAVESANRNYLNDIYERLLRAKNLLDYCKEQEVETAGDTLSLVSRENDVCITDRVGVFLLFVGLILVILLVIHRIRSSIK